MNKNTVVKSIQATASFGNVHYELFQTSKDLSIDASYSGDVPMNSTQSQVETLLSSVALGGSKHSTTYDFAKVLEKATLGPSGDGKTHYDYIVMEFDGMRMGYFYKSLGTEADAENQRALNAASVVMKEYYAQDKVAWIIATQSTTDSVVPYNYETQEHGTTSTNKKDAFFYNDVYMDNDDAEFLDNSSKTAYRDHIRELIKLLAPEDLVDGEVPNQPYLDSNNQITDTFKTFRSRVAKYDDNQKKYVKQNSGEGIWVSYANADDVFSFLKKKIGRSLVNIKDTVVTGLKVSSVYGQYKTLDGEGKPTGEWKNITTEGAFTYTTTTVTGGTQINASFDLYKVYGEKSYELSQANAVRMVIAADVEQLDLTKSDAIFDENNKTVNTNYGNVEINVINGPTEEKKEQESPKVTMDMITATYHFISTGKPDGVDSMVPETQTVKKNEGYNGVSTSEITKTGYTFVGWYSDEACTVPYVDGTVLTANKDLYGKWSKNVYTVKWNVEDTTKETDTGVEYGSKSSYDGSTPTKQETKSEYYEFLGWKIEGTEDTALIDINNYEVTDNVTFVAVFKTVTKTPMTVNITGNSATVTYNGNEKNITGYLSDYKGTDITIVLKEGVEAKAKGTDAGTYPMGLDVDDFDVTSHLYNVTLNVTDGGLIIEPSAITVNVVGNNDSEIYNNQEQSVTGFTTDDLSGTDITIALKEGVEAKAKGTDVGKYNMLLTKESFDVTSTNYDVTLNVTDGYLTITPYKLIAGDIEVENTIYNGNPQKPEFEIVVNDETLEEGKDFEFEFERTDAGTYIVVVKGKGNYEGEAFKTWIIYPKDAVIKADDKEKYYDDPDPLFTSTSEGILLSDNIAINYFRTLGEDVGGYDITPSGENQNYNITYINGRLIIKPREIKEEDITVEDTIYNKEKQKPELKLKVNEKNLIPGVDYICTNEEEDADTYEITITGIGNYEGVVLKRWTIKKLPITVKAFDNSKNENEKDPKLEVNQDIGAYAKREEGEAPGEYLIHVIVPDDVKKNYIVTTVDGKFTIKALEKTYVVVNTSTK